MTPERESLIRKRWGEVRETALPKIVVGWPPFYQSWLMATGILTEEMRRQRYSPPMSIEPIVFENLGGKIICEGITVEGTNQ